MKTLVMKMLTLAGISLSLAGCADSTLSGLLPHHDHSSRRGGLVLMDGDVHFEIVADFAGSHTVLFSDEYRRPLPASAIEEATLTVMRKGQARETLAFTSAGEDGTWSATGAPIRSPSVDVEFVYRRRGAAEPYSIELTIENPDAAHASHAHSH